MHHLQPHVDWVCSVSYDWIHFHTSLLILIHWKKVKFPGLKNAGNVKEIFEWNLLDKNCCNLVLRKCHLPDTFPWINENFPFHVYIFKIEYTRHFLAVSISFTLSWWKTDNIYCSFPLSTRNFTWSWTHDIYCTFPLGIRKCIHLYFQDQGHVIYTTHFNTT